MSNPTYVPFSMMGPEQKTKIDKAINHALDSLEAIHAAPHAAKENLMKTEFKVAAVELSFVGKILQAESAMVQAITVMADRAGKSEDFRSMIAENLPQIQLPTAKKLKA
ncbi:MAG: hypothetical protein WC436_06555 [Candidatus Babeliales bacterium]